MDKDQQIKDLTAQVEKLTLLVKNLTQNVAKLTTKNAELKERLARYENPKNSRNSSIPPSKDENRPRKTKSLRKKSGRSPGGQPGHKGNTLRMIDNPDHIVDHIPCYCGKCGLDLSDLPYGLVGRRQVIDIPPIKPEYTEYRIFEKHCSCGHVTSESYPPEAIASVNYGPGVETLVGYLHSRQYLPFRRMKELFNDVINLPISEGGLHHVIDRLTKKSIPLYEMLRTQIANSRIVGADETGAKVDGKKIWYWVWQNDAITFITASLNRGYATIEENFPNGFPNSILVTDCWRSHFKSAALGRQLCIAHLLRELTYLKERYKSNWPEKCSILFRQALELKTNMNPEHYHSDHPPRRDIEKQMSQLLEQITDEKYKELTAFKKRLVKYNDYLFTFLYHEAVPPDNNSSERAIRNIKVKQKISGQFKSDHGADRFAIIRSITDTAIKNGKNVLASLLTVAQFEPTD